METYAELTTDCIGVEGDRTVPLTVGFEEIRVGDVALAGGKGANLGELMGIPGIAVPPGFIVTTAAYRTFLRSDRRLTERIRALLQGLDPSDSEYVVRLAVAGLTTYSESDGSRPWSKARIRSVRRRSLLRKVR